MFCQHAKAADAFIDNQNQFSYHHHHMKIRNAKLLLTLLGSVALVAGCESSRMAAGGMGNETETGSGGAYAPFRTTPPPAAGTLSPANPFGLGSSSGMTTAR